MKIPRLRYASVYGPAELKKKKIELFHENRPGKRGRLRGEIKAPG